MRLLNPETVIKDFPILRHHRLDESKELIKASRMRSFQPRERLWSPGDPIAGPFFMLSGMVRVYYEGDDGEQSTLTCLWPYDVPSPGLQVASEWASYGVAVAPGICCTVPGRPFFEACGSTPQMALTALTALANTYYNRMRWEAMLRIVSLKPRLMMIFARMADALGTTAPDGILLDFPLTHEIVAGLGCVQRDQAGRTLNELAEEGLIVDRPRYRWLIPDRARLGPQPITELLPTIAE